MKVRQDAWTEENDLLLAETVLRHVREGSTQLNAFEEVGDRLDRTSAACGFRWNAVVRHQYEKALQLAKKQRKQRQRLLGKDQGGKKKLLYAPPVPSISEVESVPAAAMMLSAPAEQDDSLEIIEARPVPSYIEEPSYTSGTHIGANDLNLDRVITYLQSLKHSSIQLDILRNENERLKRENAQIKSRNDELEGKINQLEENTETIQEDYETLMKIMNRARKLVLFEEEERPATKFKMDRNGNLEKVAE
ncbi:RsfA family transcriptional regulator [Bacillus sp. DTU_2020_1000418_1_SI_GHA_SEK_038]|uniref:RsfA family transcriptional regulator n=1 Tax=Bacillus sp. DTU_2020_1000418_1_SI_GHA_SEK_038 TaxID=3077585 RepID=UPI0028F061CD|nr:RsfA family transcriptional regulator [Bacillus sp. DTU_2020_1000418_1_SI_GHA_SEK_038]WNS75324.1 RsfA family transcriptional regulator [Bacillus sp. DTU_2020_1000418_1_SI_GHA_SEK_038]